MKAQTQSNWTVKPYFMPHEDSDPLGVFVIEQVKLQLSTLEDEAQTACFEENYSLEESIFDKMSEINQSVTTLIEAAPELLSALQECVRVLAEYTQYDDDDSAEGNARLLGLAAIAKAEGRVS